MHITATPPSNFYISKTTPPPSPEQVKFVDRFSGISPLPAPSLHGRVEQYNKPNYFRELTGTREKPGMIDDFLDAVENIEEARNEFFDMWSEFSVAKKISKKLIHSCLLEFNAYENALDDLEDIFHDYSYAFSQFSNQIYTDQKLLAKKSKIIHKFSEHNARYDMFVALFKKDKAIFDAEIDNVLSRESLDKTVKRAEKAEKQHDSKEMRVGRIVRKRLK